MPLVIEEAEERDIPRLLDILYAAFHDDPWDRIMFARVPPPEARMPTTKRLQHDISVDPTASFMKVIDKECNDEIIAFARWNIYRSERPESEWKVYPPREWDEGTNVDAANEFISAIRQKREKIMAGKPHLCLNQLATDPKHSRRGAGKMLTQWGTDIADKPEPLPCYLEASPVGRPLYQRQEFEEIDTMDIDMGRWGGEGIHHHYIMIRPAKKAQA